MKILAIRGKNLASLNGEFEIDFTTEPLKSSGIFAITGPTGSGKSTLLDALCLALYDCTPRLNKAKENNVSLIDVNDKKINQNDTRSILRRGTADGYAEVDFLSVTGEEFRSTWLVRRGRNSVTGSLQPVEIRLMNLTTGEEEKGTKTEILNSIKRYVGLSFEQFNRSVLLAQGDFAMFLKAKQDEKAEILEKLTGTEIYSRVSSTIYNKAKDVINEQKLLKAKIEDITLLNDDELLQLENERKVIIEHIDSFSQKQDKINDSLKWLSDESILLKSKKEAEESLQDSIKAIELAASRFERLESIDSIQPIRDTFINLQNEEKQLRQKENALAVCNDEYKKDFVLLEKASKDVKFAQDESKKFETKCAEEEPELNRARELDVEIKENQKQLKELQSEKEKSTNHKIALENEVKKCEDQTTISKERVKKINSWFISCEKYQPLIPAVTLVKSVLDSIDNAKVDLKENAAQLQKCIIKKENIDKTLSEKKDEQERLNKLLPSEVIMMRGELAEGKPCPVCGSIHHPYLVMVEQNQTIKEDELNRSKENISKDIDRLTKDQEDNTNHITRLNTLIDNNNKLVDKSKESLSIYVSVIPKWEELLEIGELKSKVENFEKQWNEKLNEQSSLNESIIQLTAKLEGLNNEIKSLAQQMKEKEDVIISTMKASGDKCEERKNIFDGKPTDIIVKEINDKRKNIEEELNRVVNYKHSLALNAESNKTKIGQLEKDIEILKQDIIADNEKINNWLINNGSSLSRENLKELISFDVNKVVEERKALTFLTDNKKNNESVLNERNCKLKTHEASNKRPLLDETSETLSNSLAQIKEDIKKDNDRIATITVTLERNNADKNKKEKFQKELDDKKDIYESWSSLNSLFGSSDGSKFKEIAQGYTLDVLLFYANKHLEDLAPRYELQRIPDSLALQIADLDMVGEVRSVHSLSGGESFLVSLALALGLSSLSSNRMNVESLFIDEGFGSLDIDTLRVAMDALERLQMQGRKIGVISHVEEMTERIAVQVQVVKEGNGVSKVMVKS